MVLIKYINFLYNELTYNNKKVKQNFYFSSNITNFNNKYNRKLFIYIKFYTNL